MYLRPLWRCPVSLFSWFRSLGKPIPRDRPKGGGVLCDGCDEPLELGRREWLDGGAYCRRCSDEITADGGQR